PADLRDESIRFSDLSIQEGNVVLPVTLTGFKGLLIKDVVRLQWTTASEINVKNFVIERSVDGNIFTPIASIPAAGFSPTIQSYSSTDMQPLKGNNYYRLKLTDRDERFTYSDRILIKYNAVQKTALQIYPNPVLNKIDLTIPEINADVTISISNQQGRNVFTGLGSIAMLTNKINQQLSTFSAGVYFLKVYNETGYYTGKFLKH
ncbi:MAG TPA: T9SS type A sorting domain-containing protein, partial [Ferruginibacter sp.]|nr:T9SS type A sorting domain-containing protein [Ferruginibacter sp.]